jgi:predicted DNA-binding protein YlxM (UPF0122 family)
MRYTWAMLTAWAETQGVIVERKDSKTFEIYRKDDHSMIEDARTVQEGIEAVYGFIR